MESKTKKDRVEIPYRAELLRKALHLPALVIPAGIYWLGRPAALWVLVPLAVLTLGLEWARVRYDVVASVIHRVFGGMMRPDERPPPGSPVVINGATWIVLSSVLVVSIYPPTVAAAALATLLVGDAAAALVGRPFGRHRWPGSHKSVEGSLAFLIAAFAALMVFGVWRWPAALTAAGAATLIELLPLPVNDNLSVPVVAGAVLWIL